MVWAARETVVVMGPTVSWLLEMGTTPSEGSRPTVGFNPTMPHIAAGQVTDPSVSVPRAMSTSPEPTAAPLPELEPHAVQEGSNGLVVNPPTELQPLEEDVDRKLAHSDRFVFPTMMAPASRNRATTGASSSATLLIKARDPAVVAMPLVWMLSLTTTACP